MSREQYRKKMYTRELQQLVTWVNSQLGTAEPTPTNRQECVALETRWTEAYRKTKKNIPIVKLRILMNQIWPEDN